MARSCTRRRGVVRLLQVAAVLVVALLGVRAITGMQATPTHHAGVSASAEADRSDAALTADGATAVQEPPVEMRRVRRARPPDPDLQPMAGIAIALAILAWAAATRRRPEPDFPHFTPGHDPGWAARGPPLLRVS